MKKILMISYDFPPYGGGGGVFRTLKFVKYLPKFGWQPIILTIKKSNRPIDENLLLEIPNSVKIYRTITIENRVYRNAGLFFRINSKWYQIPDDRFIEWFPFAFIKAKKVIEREMPKLIYSTSPPVTSHLIAMALKKKTGLPWVADFRDPWTQNFGISYPTKIHKKIEENLEHKVAIFANNIIFNTNLFRLNFLEKYPDINPDKCITITNGYDPEDFNNVKITESNKFTISNIGSFYGDMNPKFFLKALKELLLEKPEIKKDIQVVFAGSLDDLSSKLITVYGLNEIVNFIGYVSYKESIRLMVNSNILLMILPYNGKNIQAVIPQRLFNYLATGKNILGLVPEGETSNLIKMSNSGIIVKQENVEEIKNNILILYNRWKQDNLKIEQDKDLIKKFDRETLTKRLVEIFNR